MKAIGCLELQPKKEDDRLSRTKKKLDLLYRIFNSCLTGSGHIEEALEAAEMLVEFLESPDVKIIPGLALPKWENDLSRFFIRQGLIHHAREAARLRKQPLTAEELEVLDRAIRRKMEIMSAFSGLAEYFCEEGRLEEAYLAAKLAGRSLTLEEIERIKGAYILLSHRWEQIS